MGHRAEQAKALDHTLSEISEVLRTVDEGCSPCSEVLEMPRQRLEDTRDRIRQLQGLESRLSRATARARTVPRDPAPHRHCPVIERTDGTREKA